MKRIILIAAIAVAACNRQESTRAMQPLFVEVSSPIVRQVTLTREYPGYLQADATVSITGRVNGTLTDRSYTPGERVKKGKLLFTIDPTLYINAVKQCEAAVSTAKASLDYARNNYTRTKAAAEGNAVSQIDVAQAETNVATAEAQLATAEAQLATARTNLSYCYIKAPHNGVMTTAAYSTGNYIAGAASPVQLATLYKDDVMYAYFDVTDNQWLRQQQRIDRVGKDEYITFSLGEDKYFTRKARMDYLSPNVNLSTGTLQVRALLDNADGFLRPGSYISIVLPYEKVEQGLLINDASIGTDQLGNYIYVVNSDNIVEYRHIETGSVVDDTLRLVKSGIKPGERYVRGALLKVHNGMKITPVPVER